MKRRWRPTPFLQLNAAAHLVALAGVLAAPQRWPLAAGVALASHVAMAAAGMWPRSRLLGDNLDRLPADGRHRAAVALTFDDGPDPDVTPRVLDLLSDANARASFFCIGRRARQHPRVVSEIVARGHRVENHTFSHSNAFALLGPTGLAREIDRAQEALGETAGRRPAYFRAPAGIRSPWLEPLLARRGLWLASWTRRGFDALDRDSERVARRLLDGLSARDILVVHDGSVVSRRDRTEAVVGVVRRLLDALDAAGLRAVALPEPGAERGGS